MSLSPGSTLGPYRIVAVIGAGGMGEVYRATDTRLGRDVAIKVLPDEVANQPDRLARFEREARALAALNHFNVAQVYGFEGGALVMELLEGETLRERLARGSLPIRKSIEYATQVARGLAAAHDRGIIHRDLKPENIFIVSDGHIKILDFGLARRDSEVRDIETQTARHSTAAGTVLGTVGYMSPEQVRGQQVDARSDLFSLGAVLYEMLTGTRAFRGDSSADTMAAILNEHPPDLAGIRPDASPALDRIVQHCLEKNPVERFHSARDVAFALDALSGSAPSLTGSSVARAWPPERYAWAGLTLMLIALLVWQMTRGRTAPAESPPVSRTLVPLPEGMAVDEVAFQGSRLALSPDGTKLVFQARDIASGRSRLFLMHLDGSATTPLEGTDGATGPFWSPDNREIGFVTRGRLMRLPLVRGSALPVTKAPWPFFASGAWSPAGTAVLGGPALHEVAIADGNVRVFREREGESYGHPHFLEDGQRFLFNRFPQSGEVEVHAGRIGSAESSLLLKAADLGNAQYANGVVVYAQGATIFAQRVAGDPPAVRGDPTPIGGPVEASVVRGAAFAISNNGVLVYQPIMREAMHLTWIDRKGKTIATVSDATDYGNVDVSHDNARALVSITDSRVQARDVFIVDLAREVRQRFTTDPSDERSSIWSPDGRHVLYTSKGLDFYARAADSSGEERAVILDRVSKDPYDWSRDGRWILYRRSAGGMGNDVWIAPADGSSAGRALVSSRFSDIPGTFSPDGRFIVYTSDESGQPEVYVINVDGSGKTQVSSNGGVFPIWRGDGREIVYISSDRTLMGAAVRAGRAISISAPVPLFKINVSVTAGRMYDVTADGTRFLAAIPVPSHIPPSFTVVMNWPRLMPRN